MSSLAPAPPQPRPIDRLSPSLGESLLSCGLRTAFRRDPDFSALDRGGPISALGLVSHALTEEVARGRFQGIDQEEFYGVLEQRFDQLIEAECQGLQARWPNGIVPEAKRWPGYGPTRRRLLRRLSQRPASASTPSPAQLAAVNVEELIEAPDLPLLGRPDRIARDERGTHLTDLKSSWGEMSELRPAHRRQLLIYSYIWHAIHGEWPASAAIQRLDGTRLPLAVNPDEAEQIVEDLLARRGAFNEALDADPWALAAPSQEVCEHCAYRAACPPFFEALSSEWGSYRRSLLGRTIEVEELEGSCAIQLAIEAGNLPREVGEARVLAAPSDLVLEAEEPVAIVDALPTRNPSEVILAWDSCVYSWSEAAVIV